MSSHVAWRVIPEDELAGYRATCAKSPHTNLVWGNEIVGSLIAMLDAARISISDGVAAHNKLAVDFEKLQHDYQEADACERDNFRRAEHNLARAETAEQRAAELALVIDDCRHDIKGLQAECDEANAYARRCQEAIRGVLDDIDGMEDVDDRPDGDGVRPNVFMRIQTRLQDFDTNPGSPAPMPNTDAKAPPMDTRPTEPGPDDEQLTGSRQCSSGKPHEWLRTFLYRDETTRSARVCTVCYRIELLDVSSSCNATERKEG